MDIEDGHRLGSSDVFATEACGGATHLIGSSLHDIPAPREKPIATDLASGACFGFPDFSRRWEGKVADPNCKLSLGSKMAVIHGERLEECQTGHGRRRTKNV